MPVAVRVGSCQVSENIVGRPDDSAPVPTKMFGIGPELTGVLHVLNGSW